MTPSEAYDCRTRATWSRANVALLLVDGSHAREDVEADLRAWYPALSRDALVVFDDVDYREVAEVVAEWEGRDHLQRCGHSGKLAWYRLGGKPYSPSSNDETRSPSTMTS